MVIYHLKNCDTCKKAIKALGDRVETLIDVRADGVPRDVLSGFIDKVGSDVLINTRSTTWRGLSEAERGADPVDLLVAHPTLMKRPVIVEGDRLHVGWSKGVQDNLGLG